MNNKNSLLRHLPWLVLAIVGACALGVVALRRGEAINALWIVVAAVAIYLVAYRYYSLFIANHVMQLDPRRATPAVVNNDGLDYVPTNKHILFGHHFAAIAGAGPLVGPVLAAQMGYLPSTARMMIMIRKQPNSAMVPGTLPISSRTMSPKERPLRRVDKNKTMKS